MGHRNIMFAFSGDPARDLDRRDRRSGSDLRRRVPGWHRDRRREIRERHRDSDASAAFAKAGVHEAVGPETSSGETKGFIVRTTVTKPRAGAGGCERRSRKPLGLDPKSSFQVTTIGPGWGSTSPNRALLALALSFGAILLYISVRFEYKMSITAVIALFHDVTDRARHLRAGRAGGHAEHGGGAPDDPRLLALRHHRRVPPHQGELAESLTQADVHGDGERRRSTRCSSARINTTVLSLHARRRDAVLRRRDALRLRFGSHDRSYSWAPTRRSASPHRSTCCGKRPSRSTPRSRRSTRTRAPRAHLAARGLIRTGPALTKRRPRPLG